MITYKTLNQIIKNTDNLYHITLCMYTARNSNTITLKNYIHLHDSISIEKQWSFYHLLEYEKNLKKQKGERNYNLHETSQNSYKKIQPKRYIRFKRL